MRKTAKSSVYHESMFGSSRQSTAFILSVDVTPYISGEDERKEGE
jgi:hypothetical protein